MASRSSKRRTPSLRSSKRSPIFPPFFCSCAFAHFVKVFFCTSKRLAFPLFTSSSSSSGFLNWSIPAVIKEEEEEEKEGSEVLKI